MASYGPVGLLLLLPVWLILVASGYVLMYLATGIGSVHDSIVISGSSLLTLGLFKGNSLVHSILEFSEATLGDAACALDCLSTEDIQRIPAARAGSGPSRGARPARRHRLSRW